MFENRKKPDAPREERSTSIAGPEPTPATKVAKQLKRFITRDRHPNDPFNCFLNLLDSAEKQDQKVIEDESKRLYEVWAQHFHILKREFWLVWDVFQEIEETVDGWYAESPYLAEWGPVGLNPKGYTFGASVSKNFRRNAPNPEKSLVVTFGTSSLEGGIGDERRLGRQSPMDDTLTGFQDFAGKTINEQYEGSRQLVQLLQQHKIFVRLTHKDLGQKTASLELNNLEKDSLHKICQSLFVRLNRDIMPDLEEQLQLAATPLLPK